MNKIYSFAACALFAVAPAFALTPDNEGNYRIATPQDLEDFAALVNGGNNSANGILVANIDMTEVKDHMPIGTADFPYKGTFDGRFFTIDNLVMDMPNAENIALFGYATGGAKFQNTILGENCKIGGANKCAGFVSESVGSTPGMIEFYRCGNYGLVIAKDKTTGYSTAFIGPQAEGITYKFTGCFNNGLIRTTAANTAEKIGALSCYAPKAICISNYTKDVKTACSIDGDANYWGSKGSNPKNVAQILINGTTDQVSAWTPNIFYPASSYAFYPAFGTGISNSTPENPNYGETLTDAFGVFKVKEADVPTGYIAYYLNKFIEKPIWGQDLGTNASPTFLPGTKLVTLTDGVFANSEETLPGLADLPTAVEGISADVRTSGIYTIQGVKVNNANTPGLYIINGKKVLVK